MRTAQVRIRVDVASLTKLIKKATANIEAASDETRIAVLAEWTARIVHDCVRFEIENVVPDVQKDS